MLLSDSPDRDEYRDKVDSLSPLKLTLSKNLTRSTSNFLDGIDKSPALEEFSGEQFLALDGSG
jgi:hypothetical protein